MKLLYAFIACCLLISYTTISQTISSNAPLCGNANLTLELTATGGSTYAWKGPNSFTSTQQKPSIKNVNWKNRGVYTVTIDNKTVLTIEVKILDPVAFTVPKEISVCEGGTLIIEPKSGRLTDSTEVADSYGFYDFQNNNVPNGIIENFSKKNIGNYQITGYPYSFTNSTDYGCISNQIINVKLSSNSNCKIKRIDIDDLTKIKICDNKEIIIPFKTIGDFPQGTKFKIYILGSGEGFNKPIQPDFILEKSPIIISQIPWYALHSFVPGIRILIIADDADKTTAITPFRIVTGVKEYLPNKINTTIACDSVKLFMVGNYSNYSAIDSVQWFLDGKSIKGAYKPTFFAKNSGTYTFKIKQYLNPIDNFCIYEGSPLLVETKKIEKPIIYKYGDYELCANKPIYLETPQTKNTTYQWKLDGNYILGATNTIYQTIQSGKYQVEAKESSCISISDVVEVKKPESNYRFDFYLYNCFREKLANNSYKLCKNQSFDIVLRQYPTNARLQCFRNNIIIKDTIGNYLSGLKGEGKYFVKVIYGECEEISSTITIQYGESLKINYSSRNYCEGQSPVLDISSKELEKPNTKSYKYLQGYIYKDGSIFDNWKSDSDYYSSSFETRDSGNYYTIGKILLKDGNQCNIRSDTFRIGFLKKIYLENSLFDTKLNAVPILSCEDTTTLRGYDNIGNYRMVNAKWTKDNIIIKQDSLLTLQVTQEGVYQLETRYKGYCTIISPPYKVTFKKMDVKLIQFEPLTICEGQMYKLYQPFSSDFYGYQGAEKFKYDLFKEGQLLKANISFLPPTTSYPFYNLDESGIYKLKVTNGKCEGISPDFILKIEKIPNSIFPNEATTFCTGKSVELITTKNTDFNYLWQYDGQFVEKANQANFIAETDGLYRATILSQTCWKSTPSVRLKSVTNIIPTATLTGDKKIAPDTETKLSINLTSHAPWTFKLSDGKEYTATKSPFEVSVKPLYTTTYSLSEVKNICGTGTVSGSAKIEIIILSAEEEKELNVEVFPMPSSEICHWKIETPQATNASVALYDASGITQYTHISSTRTQTHEGTIDLSTLKAGTYFLKLQAGEKSVTRKVVKF